MGFSPSCDLVFGVVADAHAEDGDYEAQPWYDEEEGDFVDLAGLFASAEMENPWIEENKRVRSCEEFKASPEWTLVEKWDALRAEKEKFIPVEWFGCGHYEDPDGPRAILRLKASAEFGTDAWSPLRVEPEDLDVNTGRIFDAIQFCKEHNLPDFSKAAWLLVASYG